MKVIFALAALVAVAIAAPQHSPDAAAVVTRQESDNIGLGNYNYAYETSNGISQQEQGQLADAPEGPGTSARGQYTYVGADGQQYTVQYVADANGFQPQGAHIPQPAH